MDKQTIDCRGRFWLIVPLVSKQVDEIQPFIIKHQWFFDHGGEAIFKIGGSVAPDVVAQVCNPGIHLVQLPDPSLYEAWNQSMDYLRDMEIDENSYIAFLGLDDELSKEFFRQVVNLVRQNNHFDFIYGNSRHLFQSRYIDHESPINPALFGINHYVFDIPHPGMMNRWGAIFNERFDTRFKLAADFDFYVGIAQKGDVTYKKLNVIQANLGASGVSNGSKAKSIYLKEWKQIENKRNIKLDLQLWRTRFMALIAVQPYLFQVLRKLWWALKAPKY